MNHGSKMAAREVRGMRRGGTLQQRRLAEARHWAMVARQSWHFPYFKTSKTNVAKRLLESGQVSDIIQHTNRLVAARQSQRKAAWSSPQNEYAQNLPQRLFMPHTGHWLRCLVRLLRQGSCLHVTKVFSHETKSSEKQASHIQQRKIMKSDTWVSRYFSKKKWKSHPHRLSGYDFFHLKEL